MILDGNKANLKIKFAAGGSCFPHPPLVVHFPFASLRLSVVLGFERKRKVMDEMSQEKRSVEGVGVDQQQKNQEEGRRSPAGTMATPSTPPVLIRKEKYVSKLQQAGSGSVVVDLEEVRRAASGWLVVGRLLAEFEADPGAILNELRRAWRLHGEVAPQRVASSDGCFVVKFRDQRDRDSVLHGQPWQFNKDGVIFAPFDGKGKPADINLGVMEIWAQIRGMDYELMTEKMGWSLGAKLGEVVEVSHRNGVIVDEYLRVRVKHPLHEPLRKHVSINPKGSFIEIRFDVKYKKLPNFACFAVW